MSLLFRVTENKRAALHPEVIQLCPSLGALDDNEILYVILAYDYCSPYRQFPEHERKRKAMWDAFGDNEQDLINSARILAAADSYLSLQYSRKVETARSYERKIDRLLSGLEDDDSPSSIKKITEAIEGLRKQLSNLEKEIDEDYQKKGVIKGDMTLSYLEELQSNMKNFKAVTAK
jgi:hypothetical protein